MYSYDAIKNICNYFDCKTFRIILILHFDHIFSNFVAANYQFEPYMRTLNFHNIKTSLGKLQKLNSVLQICLINQ